MTTRLVEQPVVRRPAGSPDRGRCAGCHVAGVLLMAGRVRQNESAFRRLEEAVGDVDRHALLTFRFQTIDQQGVIDAAVHRTAIRCNQ